MNNLRKLRKSKNLTLRELSEEVNISYSNIAMIERGERKYTSDTLKIFSDYFNVPTDYLLGISSKNDNFKDRVLQLMYDNNISQLELANAIDITQSTLSRNINGVHRPKAEIVEKIANYFGVSVDYLLNTNSGKTKLRELREEKRLSLRQVASDLNISFSNLASIERGEVKLHEETAKTFANYYGVSIDYLLGFNEETRKILIGDKIKKLREDAHVSQIELSQKINVGNKTLSDYERNISQPSLQTLLDIANFFNVSVDYLLGRDTEMNSGKDKLIKELNDNVKLLSSEQLKEILDFTLFIIKKDQK